MVSKEVSRLCQKGRGEGLRNGRKMIERRFTAKGLKGACSSQANHLNHSPFGVAYDRLHSVWVSGHCSHLAASISFFPVWKRKSSPERAGFGGVQDDVQDQRRTGDRTEDKGKGSG